jgi:hypothetical protein
VIFKRRIPKWYFDFHSGILTSTKASHTRLIPTHQRPDKRMRIPAIPPMFRLLLFLLFWAGLGYGALWCGKFFRRKAERIQRAWGQAVQSIDGPLSWPQFLAAFRQVYSEEPVATVLFSIMLLAVITFVVVTLILHTFHVAGH